MSEGTLPFYVDSENKKSLEEIMLAQIDEPDQKNCIYNIKRTTNAVLGEEMEKFFQIRVKSMQFLQKNATAIYFYDLTSQFESIKLTGKLNK